MDTYKTALQKIIQTAHVLKTHSISITESYHYGLAEDVIYDTPMPPFNKSAMDGYACAKTDLSKTLTVVETIHAGKKPAYDIKEGQCAKIMTGAAIPNGADTVFMVEHSEICGENRVRCTRAGGKSNICYKGEDIQAGDIIVPKNTFLDHRHLPLLAGAGYASVKAFKKPQVEVIATGTELAEPGEPLPPFKIRNSNSFQVLAQLKSVGINGAYKGIVKDDVESIQLKLNKALNQSDVLIMSGGVSVGDFDYVPELLAKEGFDMVVEGTAIQPGKPMVFAHKKNKYVFGLSGNPVSSFIQFELYVRPFLLALMGCKHAPKRFQLALAEDFFRKKDNRLQFLPANISNENTVVPVPFHGSAHINALSLADYLMEIPIGKKAFKRGEMVTLRAL